MGKSETSLKTCRWLTVLQQYPDLLKKIREDQAEEAAKFAAKEAASSQNTASSIPAQPQSIQAH